MVFLVKPLTRMQVIAWVLQLISYLLEKLKLRWKSDANQEGLWKPEPKNEHESEPGQEEHNQRNINQDGVEDNVKQQDEHHEDPEVDNLRDY